MIFSNGLRPTGLRKGDEYKGVNESVGIWTTCKERQIHTK